MPSDNKQSPESFRTFLTRMMNQLAGTYSNFRPETNQEQLEAYRGAITRMAGEFGRDRTAEGIQKACDSVPEFVPTPAKIREFIPKKSDDYKSGTYGGGGYGEAAVLALWQLYLAKYPPPQAQRLTKAQKDELLDQLDEDLKSAKDRSKMRCVLCGRLKDAETEFGQKERERPDTQSRRCKTCLQVYNRDYDNGRGTRPKRTTRTDGLEGIGTPVEF